MPGGERAIRQPWRMALSYLLDAGLSPASFAARCRQRGLVPAGGLDALQTMIARRLNAPLTSSMGRLFDGVAALVGVRDVARFEGQAAMELEWLATDVPADGAYPFALLDSEAESLQVDVWPCVRAVVRDMEAGVERTHIARRFHSGVVDMIAEVCGRLRLDSGVDAVVLSGGVFMNVILLSETITRLTDDGFRVYRHRLVPPNDGGLCLGQLAVAATLDAEAALAPGVMHVPRYSG